MKLNHGIAFDRDGSTLYVSSPDTAYSYPYSASSATISGPVPGTALVGNMSGSDHTTRTLLYSNFSDSTLVITRGSTANIDPDTLEIASGHSQIKSFSLTDPATSSNASFDSVGNLLGWGLRNDVGIAEHPVTGGLWSVENSVDQLNRSGVDIHANNPAEELNFLGYLNNASAPSTAYLRDNANLGLNFGYPQCFAAWDASAVPDYPGLQTGQQFAISGQDYAANDSYCSEQIAPRLVFEAHMAPLDIKFNTAGSEAWVSFHGSWNRDDPAGYKVSAIAFDPATGEPVAPSNSTTGYIDIVSNADLTQCPTHCFRPVGLAFDSAGRLWFSSDSTGEVYVITRDGSSGGSVQDATPSAAASGASPTVAPGTSPTSGAPAGSSSTAAAAVTLMMPGSEGSGRSGLAVWAVSIGAIIAAGLLM